MNGGEFPSGSSWLTASTSSNRTRGITKRNGCPISPGPFTTSDGCNRVWPPGQNYTSDYTLDLGIPPHTSAQFSEVRSVGDYFRIKSAYETPGYYDTYYARITYAH